MTEREAQLESELSEARLKIKLLEGKIDALVRTVYGQKSERLDPNQLSLLAESESKKAETPAADEPAAGVEKKTVRRKPAGPRLPDLLPVEETVVDPDEVSADPDAWRLMGEEISEQLDYEPARFFKRRLVRRKFARKDHPYQPPVIAPLPAGLQEKCLAAPSLIAHVVVSKYADHLPLYRQEQTKASLGTEMPLASPGAGLVLPPVQYLEPGKGKAPQGHFWVSSIPGGDAIYHWGPGRGAACLHDFVPTEFTGTLQCDGYKAYASFQKQRAGPIELAGCWAHARRKFFDAKEQAPKIAAWILGQIQQLYRTEKRLRETKAGPALRATVRASESVPVLARLKRALIKLKPRYLPKNSMGIAIAYALGQWENLERFLQNGAVDIDNNRVENAIRPAKLGAKNWLFIGAETSGQTSAILYTIVESAKRHGLDPYAYLRYLLEALPKSTNHQIPAMTPAAYAKRHSKTAA